MDTLAFETNYLPHLRGQIRNGSAVLFLGSGFSHGARSTAGHAIPLVSTLARDIWKLCFDDEPFEESTQLQDIFDSALLSRPKDLDNLLNRSFRADASTATDWQRTILSMPWLRIYTLNADDLAEKILETLPNIRPIDVVSATTSLTPNFDDSKLRIMHLNGTIDDGARGVTFGRSQYATRTGPEAAYLQLKNDLQFRSVVFVGSSLDEAPFWTHVELRGLRGLDSTNELRARSYLVVPTLNRSRRALLARHNVAWLELDSAAFADQVLGRMTTEPALGHAALFAASKLRSGSPDGFPALPDLIRDSRATEEYLLGATPEWADLTHGRVANRACFEELWQQVTAVRARTGRQQFLIVTGTAGTGKSSALMVVAMRLLAEGAKVAWMGADAVYSRAGFRKALAANSGLDAILIDDADLYEQRLSTMIRDALDIHPRLTVICEARSAKVGRIIIAHELGAIEPLEFAIPGLCDDDIDSILDVLEKAHRLGELKGKDRATRRMVFQGMAGRQLLVAMYKATHGTDFVEKVHQEFEQLAGAERLIYGLISVATAYRYTLAQDDIGIGVGSSDIAWLQSLNDLSRRKLIFLHGERRYRARHRVIAQFVTDRLIESGGLHRIVRAMLLIGATRTTPLSPPESAHARLLRTFMNHESMKRWMDVQQARTLYTEFEDALAWNHHYWLHRGALELETDNLATAENFLRQAKALNDRDVFVDNELAYLAFKKANGNPRDSASPGLVSEAISTLNDIVLRRPDQTPHAYHIMGQQGMLWAERGIPDRDAKRVFLEMLLRKAEEARAFESNDFTATLVENLKRAVLSLAVSGSPKLT